MKVWFEREYGSINTHYNIQCIHPRFGKYPKENRLFKTFMSTPRDWECIKSTRSVQEEEEEEKYLPFPTGYEHALETRNARGGGLF